MRRGEARHEVKGGQVPRSALRLPTSGGDCRRRAGLAVIDHKWRQSDVGHVQGRYQTANPRLAYQRPKRFVKGYQPVCCCTLERGFGCTLVVLQKKSRAETCVLHLPHP